MKFSCIKPFFIGIFIGIILTSIFILFIISAGEQKPQETSLSKPQTSNLTPAIPIPESEKAFEDELLASDILTSKRTLQDIYSQVTEKISDGDLNGAMFTLNLRYSEELSEAKNRANAYRVSPEGEVMLGSWNKYLDKLPMVLYLTQMQIENIGKNYYAKAHADKISAEKILVSADTYLQTARDEAEKISGDQVESESGLGLNRVTLPLSDENI